MSILSTSSGMPHPVKSAPKAKGPPLRRDYSLEFKLKIVRETLMPGASVSIVARRHDLNSNMLFRWRREYKNGELRWPSDSRVRYGG
jgi:transposase